ncbi:MAG: Maf family protein [Deltaproteobacteria bacterium]|nr:Maf family protein [Deltaproteobacteria bacterium]
MAQSFILASVSPRRRMLLKEAGLDFEVIPSGIHETFRSGETVREHVIRLSREKAREVSSRRPGSWVLAADTIVVIDGDVIGKPRTPQDARMILTRLSGREHTVVTGFTVMHGAGISCVSDAVESKVLFKTIPGDEIEWYITTDEPYDKAGGYAVQGKAAFFIKEIRGSHTNVIGLPLCEVMQALKNAGVVSFQ